MPLRPDVARADPSGALLSLERLAAVRASGLLDHAAEQSWDQLTGLAAKLLRAPIAMLSVADESRSHWLSCVGVDPSGPDGPGVPIEHSFCQYVIDDRGPFVVADTASHPRTRDNAAVRQLGVRLLTPPPQPDHLHLVVRYRPAGHHAQVGGDWYDAFLQPDGATMLVIGDVIGHDRTAAAQMGQLRGLLRALAYAADGTAADTPAGVLTNVEHAARGLAVDTLATVVLARIERRPDVPVVGTRTLRWSNAGHLPPLLLLQDGSSRLLDTPADLLLGVEPSSARQDHALELPDSSTLLLFTDGLVERRGSTLDHGLQQLRESLVDLGDSPLDELCDTLLDRLAPDPGEDDIALLAVRAYPEDRPRPAEAGPNRLPRQVRGGDG